MKNLVVLVVGLAGVLAACSGNEGQCCAPAGGAGGDRSCPECGADGDGDGDGDGLSVGGTGAVGGVCGEEPKGAGPAVRPANEVSGSVVVTSAVSSGPGSLRQAVQDASAGSTITFDLPGDAPTIKLEGQIDITKDVVIDGGTEPGLVISGSKKGRLFDVKEGNALTLRSIKFVDGFIPTDYGGVVHTWERAKLTVEYCDFEGNVSRGGGALFVRDFSELTVEHSRFIDNDGATHGDQEISGGAIGTISKCEVVVRHSELRGNKGINGGGIYTIFSNLTIEDSIFVGNDSSSGAALGSPTSSIAGYTRGHGGAIYIDGASRPHEERFYINWNVDGDAEGGKVLIKRTLVKGNKAAGNGGGAFLFGYAQDQVTVEDSVFTDNKLILDKKPEARGGGIFFGPTPALVTGSTFARNTTEGEGGGIFWSGPGDEADNPGTSYIEHKTPFVITNSTFAGNQGKSGGGLYTAVWYPGLVSFTNVTFAKNEATIKGGAIFDDKGGTKLTNCLFSDNKSPEGATVNQSLADQGGNIQFPAGDVAAVSNVTIVDPMLSPLAPSNGPTWIFALPEGSPAIDAGVTSGAPAVDQRGQPRGDGKPDVGAFERQAEETATADCSSN